MVLVLALVFVAGYTLIVFEHALKLDKALSALITGVVCWIIIMSGASQKELVSEHLMSKTAEIASIVFFLLGAMTIVELIESHKGFDLILNWVKTKNIKKLLWIISFMTFFISSILDNLTTAIIMVMVVRKLIPERKLRIYFVGAVVIAANAGGAWTPIGDVTTTMLWINHNITSLNVIQKVFLPSLVNLLVPLLIITALIRNEPGAVILEEEQERPVNPESLIILCSGILLLISIPVFKAITHLPPYMAMFFALGILWLITELMHKKKVESDRYNLSVLSAIRKLDMTVLLFFIGILLAVSALENSGILAKLASNLDSVIGNLNYTAVFIGLLSAIVDNVPLVAASMGMYPLSLLPTDHTFWVLLTYSAGTGGSILIIGSAAGVAAMGLEKVNFFEYLKKIGTLALIGYFAGIGVFLVQFQIMK